MNIGECPYPDCNNILMHAVPKHTPAYIEDTCTECGGKYWYRLSRIDPEAWTDEDFHKEFIIDHENYSIMERQP